MLRLTVIAVTISFPAIAANISDDAFLELLFSSQDPAKNTQTIQLPRTTYVPHSNTPATHFGNLRRQSTRKRPLSPDNPTPLCEKSFKPSDHSYDALMQNIDISNLFHPDCPSGPPTSCFPKDSDDYVTPASSIYATQLIGTEDPLSLPYPPSHPFSNPVPSLYPFTTPLPSPYTELTIPLSATSAHEILASSFSVSNRAAPQEDTLPPANPDCSVQNPLPIQAQSLTDSRSCQTHCSPPSQNFANTPLLLAHPVAPSPYDPPNSPSSSTSEHELAASTPLSRNTDDSREAHAKLHLHHPSDLLPPSWITEEILQAFWLIIDNEVQANSAVRSLCAKTAYHSLSSILSNLERAYPEKRAELAMIGELYVFLLSAPSLDLNLLQEVTTLYPAISTGSQEQKDLSCIQKQIKLTYTLQTLRSNLITSAENLTAMLTALNLDQCNLENALHSSYALLQGEQNSTRLKDSMRISHTAYVLCCPSDELLFENILSCLDDAEKGKKRTQRIRQTTIKTSASLSPSEIIEVYESVTHNPDQAKNAVKSLYLKQLAFNPPASFSMSDMLSTITRAFHPTSTWYAHSVATQSLADCLSFLLSDPPLDVNLLSEVRKHYPHLERFQHQKAAKSTQNSSALRLQTRLTYTLQTLRAIELTEDVDFPTLIKHFQLEGCDVEDAFCKAYDVLNKHFQVADTGKRKHVKNTAHTLCNPTFLITTSLSILQNIESTHTQTNNKPSTDSPPASPLISSDVYQHHSVFILEKLEEILEDKTQIFIILQEILHTVYVKPPHLTTVSAIFNVLYNALGGKTNNRASQIIHSIGALCAFILSEPSFDIRLFEEVKAIYPTPIQSKSARTDGVLIKVRALRLQMKLTYTLQNLKQNLTCQSPTLQDLLTLLKLDPSNGEKALQEAHDLAQGLTANSNLQYPPTVSEQQSLCARHSKKIKILLEKAEEQYLKKNPQSYTSLLQGGQ